MDPDDRLRIREELARLLAGRDDRRPFADSESLIRAGRLDSLAVVELVTYLESAFGVDFTRIEFDPERLDSLDSIAGVVSESRGAA